MTIRIAESDAEIAACFPVMRELRPRLRDEAEFVRRVRDQERDGYRVACVEKDGIPVAVAGFRVVTSLSWGRFLYVDDLVTLEAHRSRGHGKALLGWLRNHARERGCGELHLDSGLQRKDAHRFYVREGMTFAAHHYFERL